MNQSSQRWPMTIPARNIPVKIRRTKTTDTKTKNRSDVDSVSEGFCRAADRQKKAQSDR